MQEHAGRIRRAIGCTIAAQQHLVQQYYSSCHNHEDYAGGVEFEVFDPLKAHENASLTKRMIHKLRTGTLAWRTVPTGNLLLGIANMFDVQVERFGDSTGPLQTI